jgi:hypothetical protein
MKRGGDGAPSCRTDGGPRFGKNYSTGGDAWRYFPHDHARSRVYRWGKMVCWESVTDAAVCVLRSRCGTDVTRFSRSAFRGALQRFLRRLRREYETNSRHAAGSNYAGIDL